MGTSLFKMVFLRSLPLVLFFGFSLGKEVVTNREGKVFSLFSVVTFPNNQCTAKSSTTSTPVYGTCFSNTECTSKGGTVDGNCAAGFGVCCTFLVSDCSSTVTQNCTYIQNPSYPSSYTTAGSCEYNVTPLSSDICQSRLDLDVFDTTDDSTAGTCTDTFAVTSGSSRLYPNLCGTLTGQHIYMETGRKTSDQVLTFTVATTSTVSTWRIEVTQIECYSTSKARNDCLQYFTGVTGEVKSFNFGVGMIGVMSYNICVRREAGMCGIAWRESSTTSPDPFLLDDTLTTDGAGWASVIADVNAYVSIPGSECATYSGMVLNNDCTVIGANMDNTPGVVSSVGYPFELTFTNVIAATAITGFNLVYNQIPCGNLSPQTTQA